MNHYKVLGLNKNASKAEIKEAFRKMALQFHPDKHTHSPQHVRDEAVLKFRAASIAYQALITREGSKSDNASSSRANYNSQSRSSSSSSSSSGGQGYSSGKKKSQSGYKPRSSTSTASKWGFDPRATLQYMTSRPFRRNLAFASALLGGAVIVKESGDALSKEWRKFKDNGIVQNLEKRPSLWDFFRA